jgi:hypothetical protein
MQVLGVFVAAVLALGPAADGADAAKAAKKAAKKGGAVAGTVIDVKRPDPAKSAGSITIKLAEQKKKKAAAPAVAGKEVTFKVTAQTKFVKVEGKKGEQKVGATTFGDVVSGATVQVTAVGDTATAVKVMPKKKKNKA